MNRTWYHAVGVGSQGACPFRLTPLAYGVVIRGKASIKAPLVFPLFFYDSVCWDEHEIDPTPTTLSRLNSVTSFHQQTSPP